MKIVLISPPENLDLKAEFISTQYPLNLGYLAAVLKKENFSVEIWDYVVEDFGEKIFIEKISKSNPQLIGFTTTSNILVSLNKLSGIIKNNFSNIKIIAGGSHASALPERTLLEIPALDYVCVGEGEYTLLELCKNLESGENVENIKGLVYRNKEKQITINEKRPLIPDIDLLPFPERGLINSELYNKTHVSRGIPRKIYKVCEILTTRGCPSSCIFCATHISYGYKVRLRSAKNVLAEAKMCVEKYGAKHLSILDDLFTLDHARTIEMCHGFRKLGVSWNCDTRVNNITKDLLKLMAECGCIKVSFGVESGSDRMLKLIKKNITIAGVNNAIGWAKEAGIRFVEGTFILGAHPSETKEEVSATLELIKKLDFDFISYGIIVPFPGTEVYKIMRDRGYLKKTADWSKFIFFGGVPQWRTEHFSAKELVEIQKNILRKFYLRPSYLLKILRKINSWQEAKYYLSMGIDFIKRVVF